MKVLHEGPGGGPAPIIAAPVESSLSASTLRGHLDRLQDLDGTKLREECRRLFRSEPPRISRDLLIRGIAYRIQELEFGGLPKWARQSLAGATAESDQEDATGATNSKPPEPSPLKPGARLVREWHGRTYVVAVLDRAFEFNGRRFGSLTQIACEITGAHWSGPRFFGLMKRRTAQGLGLASPRATCAGEMSVPSQLKQSRPSNEEQPAICGAQEADGERVRPRAGDSPYG